MENEEKRIKEEIVDNCVFNDESMFRCLHTFKDGIVSADELNAWINSPITKALIKRLDYYCMTVAMEEKDNGDLVMHIMGQFDIKKGILKRDKQARKDLNRYKDGQG